MSHFYGVLEGSRGQATRCGTKSSGMDVIAAGWQGALVTHLRYNADQDRDEYRVYLEPWYGSGGHSRLLSTGVLNATIADIDKE